MFTKMKSFLAEQLKEIAEAGLHKDERIITSRSGCTSPWPTGAAC